MHLWFQLLLCLVLIGIAGWFLSRNGDIIAEKTGLSGSWIGLLLLATATSLPEGVTGISSVTAAGTPDIAVGNILGAAVFNLAFLIVLDALYRKETLYSRAAHGHILSAAFGALMIAFVGFSLLLDQAGISPTLGHVGAYSPFIVLIYLVAMRAVYQYEQRTVANFVEDQTGRYAGISLRRAVTGYALAAVFVLVAGAWLPFVASELATLMGWQQSFVGALLVAAITTAPEAVVTLSALRLGAIDMAIANLLGSNLFNMVILAIDDLAYLPGSLLANVNETHALTALTGVMMSALVIAGLVFRPRGRALLGLSWISLGLLFFYVINAWILFAA